MFLTIFRFEVKYWLKSWAFYLYWAVLFCIAFVYFIGSAGIFDEPSALGAKTIRMVNSPFEINYLMGYFNKLFLFLLPAIVGATLYKDYKHRAHSILYSFPIKKRDYLFGKLFSSLFIVLMITTSVAIAMMMAEQLPYLDLAKVTIFNPLAYLETYLIYTIPNMLMYGTMVFAVVLWFRNVYAAFGAIILLFSIQSITQNAFDGQGYLIALFDPFAENTANFLTQFWTLKEKNVLPMPWGDVLLYNRAIWMAGMTLVFGLAYRAFSFTQEGFSFSTKKSKRPVVHKPALQRMEISKVKYSYGNVHQWICAWNLSSFQTQHIVRTWSFLATALMGVLTILFILSKVTNGSDLVLLPITRVMLMVPALFFNGIVILATFIYSGILIHRERLANMAQLSDASAAPEWVVLLSKVLAVVKVQMLLLLILLVAGVIIQAYNGYYRFEIDLYIFHLFGLMLMPLVTWTLASFFIHALFPNIYVGLFVLVIGWIGTTSLQQIGIDSYLLQFNSMPPLGLSDMNGYGNGLLPYFLVSTYWFVFGLLLFVGTKLLWLRGVNPSVKERMAIVTLRWNPFFRRLSLGLLLIFILLGWKIYLEEEKSTVLTQKEQDKAFRVFESKFKKYSGHVQPKMTRVFLNIDIFPEQNRFYLEGRYSLLNKSDKAMDTLLVKTGFDESTNFSVGRETTLIGRDDLIKFSVLKLSTPLEPGDSLQFEFVVQSRDNTYFQKNSNVLTNGSFIGLDVLPRFGYSFESKPDEPDTIPVRTNYMSPDADFVHMETHLSTSLDQMATAPGYLIKEWIENGRRYYIYQMDKPIKFSFAFNSGEYERIEDQWEDVKLEVLYHDGHSENLNKFLSGAKAALSYNSKYMGAFQHRQMRMIEFPESEGTFATTMGNIMPISERRFVANTNDEEGKIDESFYVAAHEMTHQWWGAKVVPADTRGAMMLSESVTEYLSLRIYEERYGIESANKFLNFQRLRYLKGRTAEEETESPLMRVLSEQHYIFYGKGALAFNALYHSIGETSLNQILRDFLQEHQKKNPPYPTSIQFVDALRSGVPDALHYVIEDWFETVTFYENSIENVSLRALPEGKYAIDLKFKSKKTRQGVEEAFKLNGQSIQILLQDDEGQTIDLVSSAMLNDNHISIEVQSKPSKLTLDPNWLFLEKNLEDNVFRF